MSRLRFIQSSRLRRLHKKSIFCTKSSPLVELYVQSHGRPDAQAGQWLSEQLGARGLDAHALDAPSPYEMPAHAVSQGAAYGPAGLTDALAELAAWFGNAGLSLGSIQRQMIGRKFAASPVRCWPHHFDLATLTTLPARNADAT